MRRRDLIAAGTTLAAAAAVMATASSALASDKKEPTEGAATVNIAGVGLPVITDGRLRNYVFVTVKLTLGDGATIEQMHAKDPFFRDALVRASHRVPFTVPNNWVRLNENAINAAVMAIADVVCGHGAVVKSEVLMQSPRRQTGLPAG
ncbi:hypothetical protein BH10PSE1_BH10PSE1_27910 [soil metagenome]